MQSGHPVWKIRDSVITIRYRQQVSVRKIYSPVNVLEVKLFRLVKYIKMNCSNVVMQKVFLLIQKKDTSLILTY